MNCAQGYVPSGDGVLECGVSTVGQLEYEFCQRFSLITDAISATCEDDNDGVRIGVVYANTPEKCVQSCDVGCNSFRILATGECELWSSECPNSNTKSSTDIGDYAIPQEGSCLVTSLDRSIEGLMNHTCGLSKISTGRSCNFDCAAGFTLDGPGRIDCLSGTLTILNSCLPNNCTLPIIANSDSIDCSLDGVQQSGHTIVPSGSMCSVNCSTGYHQRNSADDNEKNMKCYAQDLTPSTLYCDPNPCDVRSLVIAKATDVGCFSSGNNNLKAANLAHGDFCTYVSSFCTTTTYTSPTHSIPSHTPTVLNVSTDTNHLIMVSCNVI